VSKYEVVRSDVEGWDVRRVGEAQALSNYATRELAEEAARKQQDAEDRTGSDADAIDVRQDVFSEGPEEDLDVKRTFLGMSAVMLAVILLIVVVGAVVALTNFAG
jgi:ABC-type Na+ efflux pump permease subunit